MNEPDNTNGCFCRWFNYIFCFEHGIKRANQITNGWHLDAPIEIEINDLPVNKRNQIKRVRKLIQTNRAYSLYYYGRARIWKYVYWTSNLLGIILTSANTVINVFYDPCSSERAVQNYNIIFGALITTCLGAFTFLNSSLRRRQYEEAGDEYKILAFDLYRKAFFTNTPLIDRDLGELLDEYSIRFEAYAKIYDEPTTQSIIEIMNRPDFDMQITFN